MFAVDLKSGRRGAEEIASRLPLRCGENFGRRNCAECALTGGKGQVYNFIHKENGARCAGGGGASSVNNEEKILSMLSDMRGDLQEIKSDVAELKVRVGNLEADVAVLKADVAGLKTDVAGLKTDVAGLKTDMTDLKGRVARLEDCVDELREAQEETRDGVNVLLEWAEACGNVIKFPLPRIK